MSNSAKHKRDSRIRRHARVRKHVRGSAERPRLAVFRSNKHIVAQVIDDRDGRTLAAASTHETDLRDGATSNIDAATTVGRLVATRAKDAGVSKVVFDRGGNLYHGRVKALADAARAEGLEF
jgi:large subunit ribosomal protein L18